MMPGRPVQFFGLTHCRSHGPVAHKRRPICGKALQPSSPTTPMAVPAWAKHVRLGRREPRGPTNSIIVPDSETDSAGTLLRLLTIAQVANRLQVSQKTIRRMIASGQLRAVRLRRALRITGAEYRRLVDGGQASQLDSR